jgi:predicted alpha/beta superfamily hydrolase
VNEKYPTDGRSFLVGESAAGHFVVQTWMESPDLFDGYAAISPSLQWNDENLSREFAQAPEHARPPLYLSLADEGGATESGMMRMLDAVPEKQPHCFSDRREDLRHANSLHGLLPEALQFLMPTGADYLTQYGLTLRCERGEAAK